MSARVYVGSFTKDAGTVSQSITGVGFTPKACIFFSSAMIGTGFADGNAHWSYGYDDGTNHRCTAGTIHDNASSSSSSDLATSGGYTKNGSVLVMNRDTLITTAVRGDVTAWTADGFTFMWTASDAAFTGMVVSFIAIGGSGVSAFVGSAAQSGTGNHVFTGVGFLPSLVCLSGAISDNGTDTSGHTTNFQASHGWMNGSCQGTFSTYGTPNVPIEDARRYQRNDKCLAIQFANVSINNGLSEYTFVSMDADGFTINRTGNTGPFPIFYLALSGVAGSIGSFSQPVGVGTYTVSDLGLAPVAVITASIGLPTSGAVQQDGMALSVGASDGTNHAVQWVGALFNADPTVCTTYHDTTSAMIAADAEATSGTLLARLSGVTFQSDSLQFLWSNVTAARQVLFLALGDFVYSPSLCPSASSGVVVTTTVYEVRCERVFLLPSSPTLKKMFLKRLEFVIQTAVGLSYGQGSDPQMMISISRDGGRTWGPEFWLSMGKIGEFRRAYKNALGNYRHGAVKVVISDPVFIALLGADATLEEGIS